MAHNECGWKWGEGAERTAIVDENYRHVGTDKTVTVASSVTSRSRAAIVAIRVVAFYVSTNPDRTIGARRAGWIILARRSCNAALPPCSCLPPLPPPPPPPTKMSPL